MDAASIDPAGMATLVQRAKNLARKISNSDDAESDGMLGLTKAIAAYDPDNPQGASLYTYAMHRVRGEVLDGLRERDHLARSDRRKVKAGVIDLDGVMEAPLSLEVILMPDKRGNTVTFDPPDPGLDWEKLLDDRDRRQRLDALWRLIGMTQSPRTMAMMRAYYIENLSLRQVGERFGVTESRVSQLFKKVHAQLADLCGVVGLATWKQIYQVDKGDLRERTEQIEAVPA